MGQAHTLSKNLVKLDLKGYKLVTAVTFFVTFYIIVAELLFVKLLGGGVFVHI